MDPSAARAPLGSPSGENAIAAQQGDPRVRMAAERTLLAWIRTALAMMGFGFVVARFGLFLREMSGLGGRNRGSGYGFSLPIGLALIVLGVGVSLLAAHQHFRLLRALRAGHVDIPISFVGIAVAVILGAIGLSMCVYIVAVSS